MLSETLNKNAGYNCGFPDYEEEAPPVPGPCKSFIDPGMPTTAW